VVDPTNRRVLAESGFVVYLRTGIERQLERLQRDRSGHCCARRTGANACSRWRRNARRCTREIADLVYESDHASVATAADLLLAQLPPRWRRTDAGHAA
jgi:shikimate kinase